MPGGGWTCCCPDSQGAKRKCDPNRPWRFFPRKSIPSCMGFYTTLPPLMDWSSGNLWGFVFGKSLGMKGSFRMLTRWLTFCKASSPGSGGILGMSWPERNVTGNAKSRGPCLNLVNLNVLTLQPSAQFSKYKMEHTMAVNASEARRAAKLEISILQLSRSPHRLPWCFCGVS